MGYWTEEDLPLTYALASTFPIGDRWFCSCLAQTDPQRRYLIAATSSGMTDDIGTGPGNIVPNATLGAPANGTIFQRMSDAGITWADYNASFPTGATMELYPDNDARLLGDERASRSRSSSPTQRPARCRSSACSTPTSAPSRRRTRRTSPSARASSAR